MILAVLLMTAALTCGARPNVHHAWHRLSRSSPPCPRDATWATRTNLAFFKLSSQSWQDGYLAYVFQNIGVTNKFYVEFGFNADSFEGGSGANTYVLHSSFGWQGLLLDGDHSNATINLHRAMVLPDTIVSLFDKHNVPLEPDYVSIDVDSCDVLLLEALLASKYSPRVLTVEYNANFPLNATISVTPSTSWNGHDRRYGASLGAIHAVARRHGYSIVNVVPGLDAVLVRDDALCGGDVLPVDSWKHLTGTPTHHACIDVAECVHHFMDSEVYFATKDVGKAQQAAADYMATHLSLLL